MGAKIMLEPPNLKRYLRVRAAARPELPSDICSVTLSDLSRKLANNSHSRPIPR